MIPVLFREKSMSAFEKLHKYKRIYFIELYKKQAIVNKL